MTTHVVTGLFAEFAQAEAAARHLESLGIPHADIALIAHGGAPGLEEIADTVGKGAGLGTLAGGTGGLLASLGLVAIPGIGPAMAAGWLAALAVGGAAGAAAGGLVGALIHAGVAHDEAHAYAEGVRRGGTFLTARIPDRMAATAAAAMEQAVNIHERAERYRRDGWTRFDAAASPLDRDQLAAERASHIFV